MLKECAFRVEHQNRAEKLHPTIIHRVNKEYKLYGMLMKRAC